MLRSFIYNDDAVNVQIGYILNLVVLILVTGGISGTFYLYADSSSQQSMRTGFTDLGSQIARDITNMYLISEHSSDNFSMNVKRDIPLTIGGKGYRIKLKPAQKEAAASVNIAEGSFSGYEIVTTLNAVDSHTNADGTVYSGSGEMNITMIKNNSGVWVWLK